MLFNSLHFLVFFVLVTIVYFAIPHKYRWFLLLSSSCYFYMAFIPVYILILGFTIVIDYFAGIYLEKTEGKMKKWFLIASLIANIGVLAIFKYYNFLNDNLTGILGTFGHQNPVPYLSIILPIGLSFHTFQAMSYTIEVYRGKQKAERNFGILHSSNNFKGGGLCFYDVNRADFCQNYGGRGNPLPFIDPFEKCRTS